MEINDRRIAHLRKIGKNKAIAQALRIHKETVRAHITDWTSDEKLKPENGGSYSKLDKKQSQLLEKHLEQKTYTRVIDICVFVESETGIRRAQDIKRLILFL